MLHGSSDTPQAPAQFTLTSRKPGSCPCTPSHRSHGTRLQPDRDPKHTHDQHHRPQQHQAPSVHPWIVEGPCCTACSVFNVRSATTSCACDIPSTGAPPKLRDRWGLDPRGTRPARGSRTIAQRIQWRISLSSATEAGEPSPSSTSRQRSPNAPLP